MSHVMLYLVPSCWADAIGAGGSIIGFLASLGGGPLGWLAGGAMIAQAAASAWNDDCSFAARQAHDLVHYASLTTPVITHAPFWVFLLWLAACGITIMAALVYSVRALQHRGLDTAGRALALVGGAALVIGRGPSVVSVALIVVGAAMIAWAWHDSTVST